MNIVNKNSPVIKQGVSRRNWKFKEENARKVAICINSSTNSDGETSYDVIAEYDYDYFLSIRNKLNVNLEDIDWWTIGGYELGFLYPLLAYYEIKSRDESDGS